MHSNHPTDLARHTMRPPEDFFLPAGYQQQPLAYSRDTESGDRVYWTQERIENSRIYQYHVYRWAASLITAHQLRSVLDLGCGTGLKLQEHIAPVCDDIVGIDQPAGVAAARRLGAPGIFHCADLDSPTCTIDRTFDLIICSDVIEHLLDPDPMIALARRLSHPRSIFLFSTPDRVRLRGRSCRASTKAEHVREWAADEFLEYLEDRGLVVMEQRFLPADDSPLQEGLPVELAYMKGEAPRSPHRCHAVLCTPS